MRYLSLLFFLIPITGYSFSNFIYVRIVKESNLEQRVIVNFNTSTRDLAYGGVEIEFGDGVVEAFPLSDAELKVINNQRIYSLAKKHAYPGAGEYTVSARVFNRVSELKNILNSVNTPVYVETRFIIDSYIGCNNTPRIENIPLFAGSVSGEKYIQDFSIIDSDSDSVSFEYVIPKYDDNANVLNYRLPFQYNISENQDISQLAFDQNQCSMMFNTATGDNRYCMDFLILEWRKKDGQWHNLSSTMVDFNVYLEDTENHSPDFTGVRDTAIIAGNIFESIITATDPENDSIQLNSYGDFLRLTEAGKIIDTTYYPGPVQKTIRYTPAADVVREKPYKVVFSAIDSKYFGRNESMYVWITDKSHNPEPVSVFTGQALSDGQINVYWQDTDDELGYILERSDKFFPQFERLAVLPANAALYEDSSVVVGNTYQYRIKAVGTKMSDYTVTEVSTGEIITALAPIGHTESLLISPNPSHGVFRISNAEGIRFMEILDIFGRTVWVWQVSSEHKETKEMEISPNLKSGTYILNLVSYNKTHSEKIVID